MEEDNIHHHHHTPTFKSIVSSVTTFDDLDYDMAEVINFQNMFEKSTTPWEQKNLWPGDTLQKFEIDLKKIDRVYHFDFYDTERYNEQKYELIARMIYDDIPLYIYLKASCGLGGIFESEGNGSIYLSYNVDIFMKTILTSYHSMDLIYELLLRDGIMLKDE